MLLQSILVTAHLLTAIARYPACDPAWLPISRPAVGAFFVATSSRPTPDGVRARILDGRGTAPKAGPVMLVGWFFGPDCSPIPRDKAHPWTPPAEAAFYTAQLRPRRDWIAGMPTLDVRFSIVQPLLQTNDERLRQVYPTTSLLTPAEFLDFYASLPTNDELSQQPTAATARVKAWASAHPALAQREPARSIMANLERATGRPGR
jgi:hypothetical protein